MHIKYLSEFLFYSCALNICLNFYFTHAHYTVCHLIVIRLITQTLLEEEYKL